MSKKPEIIATIDLGKFQIQVMRNQYVLIDGNNHLFYSSLLGTLIGVHKKMLSRKLKKAPEIEELIKTYKKTEKEFFELLETKVKEIILCDEERNRIAKANLHKE